VPRCIRMSVTRTERGRLPIHSLPAFVDDDDRTLVVTGISVRQIHWHWPCVIEIESPLSAMRPGLGGVGYWKSDLQASFRRSSASFVRPGEVGILAGYCRDRQRSPGLPGINVVLDPSIWR
jgi:hypothetical protein